MSSVRTAPASGTLSGMPNEATQSRASGLLRRALALLVLIVAVAIWIHIVIGLVMTVVWIVVGLAVVAGVLWALKTLVW